jgi:hypothetical protein
MSKGFYANNIKKPHCPICNSWGLKVKHMGFIFGCDHEWDWKTETVWR